MAHVGELIDSYVLWWQDKTRANLFNFSLKLSDKRDTGSKVCQTRSGGRAGGRTNVGNCVFATAVNRQRRSLSISGSLHQRVMTQRCVGVGWRNPNRRLWTGSQDGARRTGWLAGDGTKTDRHSGILWQLQLHQLYAAITRTQMHMKEDRRHGLWTGRHCLHRLDWQLTSVSVQLWKPKERTQNRLLHITESSRTVRTPYPRMHLTFWRRNYFF